MLEQRRIPVNVENVEELYYRLIVNPEYPVVHFLGQRGIIIQGRLQIICPVVYIQFRVVPLPPQVAPRVLHLNQENALYFSHVQDRVRMSRYQARSLFICIRQFSGGSRYQTPPQRQSILQSNEDSIRFRSDRIYR